MVVELCKEQHKVVAMFCKEQSKVRAIENKEQSKAQANCFPNATATKLDLSTCTYKKIDLNCEEQDLEMKIAAK